MITKWKIIDPIFDNTTTFRFWCDDESNDLIIAEYLTKKYVESFGFTTKGTIKIVYNAGLIFYECITTLPYDIYKKNNNYIDFSAVNAKKIKGVKKII